MRFFVGSNNITKNDTKRVNQLMRQLNPNAPNVNFEWIEQVMKFGTIITIRDILADGNALIGMGTLVPIRKLFHLCGNIEDVIVDEAYRGKGFGKRIIRELLCKSDILGIESVDLTSNPKRETANKLYKTMGFELRETNLYRKLIKFGEHVPQISSIS